MKTNLLKRNEVRLYTLLIVCLITFTVSAQQGEMLNGGGMEASDESSWTVNFTGMKDQPTTEFGSTETCSNCEGGALRVKCSVTEYANLVISQQVSLKANTVYMAKGSIKDLTNGELGNWWAQLKLKVAEAPDDENDGVKLYGFNTWKKCPDTLVLDGTWQDDACDTYGLNDGEIPDLSVLDDDDNLIDILNFKTPDTLGPVITYHFAILIGVWANETSPKPYDILIDKISLIDSVASTQPEDIESLGYENMVNLTNYPNPFSSFTNISYELKESSDIKLSVYNLLGEEIVCLYEGQKQPGKHTVTFDASNLNSSMFLCKIKINDTVIVRKMSLFK
jgi:hypothetical protein